jgi:hypothetical protein
MSHATTKTQQTNTPNQPQQKKPIQTPQTNPNQPQTTPSPNKLSPNSILYTNIYIELGLNLVYPFNKHPHIFSYTIPQVYEHISFKSPPHDYNDSSEL